jgi:neutral trehalase
MLCDCTVVIVFACFFIEANLNKIIAELGRTEEMKEFLHNKHPGLRDKLAWFYNEYVAIKKAENKKQFESQKIYDELLREFPGFGDICDFRNKISHGVIDKSLAYLENAEQLRIKAKEIVENLFTIVSKAGNDIPRPYTYEVAISSNYDSPHSNSFEYEFRPVIPSSS